MDAMLKKIFTDGVLMVLAGFVGGWISVQITLTELRVNAEHMNTSITQLERIASQHQDFDRRIARLEVQCDDVRQRVKEHDNAR